MVGVVGTIVLVVTGRFEVAGVVDGIKVVEVNESRTSQEKENQQGHMIQFRTLNWLKRNFISTTSTTMTIMITTTSTRQNAETAAAATATPPPPPSGRVNTRPPPPPPQLDNDNGAQDAYASRAPGMFFFSFIFF
jgi:hypothetical protein